MIVDIVFLKFLLMLWISFENLTESAAALYAMEAFALQSGIWGVHPALFCFFFHRLLRPSPRPIDQLLIQLIPTLDFLQSLRSPTLITPLPNLHRMLRITLLPLLLIPFHPRKLKPLKHPLKPLPLFPL